MNVRSLLALILVAIPLAPAVAQDWQPVTEALIVAEKPGFGKLCGVVVDHQSGDVTINLSDKGLYRSNDVGKTWQKIGMPFKGRTETPGCLMLDPTGGKQLVAAALVYGADSRQPRSRRDVEDARQKIGPCRLVRRRLGRS